MSDIKIYDIFPFPEISGSILKNTNSFSVDLNKSSWSIDIDFNITVTGETHRYDVDFKLNKFNHLNRLAIVVCVKDNPNILNFCLDNLQKCRINKYCDILIIDDRSKDDSNLELAKKYNCSYIKVNNSADIFNYSNLNNIAAAYCNFFEKQKMICWNSDMWTDNPDTFLKILDCHHFANSSITGTRLIYPPKEQYENIFGSYKHVLGDSMDKYYNTIQHGGIVYVPSNSLLKKNHLTLLPFHQWRFWNKDYYMANLDIPCVAVTGALHVLNLADFISLGGYNMSLASSFQDIDLCQRAIQKGKTVLYAGSQQLYHAETITNNSEGNLKKPTMVSDRILYEYIWWKNPAVFRNILGIEKL